jgi:hypothetical protein
MSNGVKQAAFARYTLYIALQLPYFGTQKYDKAASYRH